MLRLYTCLFTLALPFILARLYWRGFKAPAYRERWAERLGIYRGSARGPTLWFHCVSVGEAEAAFPLIRLLQAELPASPLVVTTTTPTGSARVKAVLGDSVEHVYLPYDLPWVIARFLRHFRPRMAVFMEKELWPNICAACRRHAIPLFIVNARLSARSAASYRKIPSLSQSALATVAGIACQTLADRQNFLQIGALADSTAVLGNLKFDLSIDAEVIASGRQLKRSEFKNRFVWILASTHQDEEAQLMHIYPKLKRNIPELLLIIAPRHPERFHAVERVAQEQGLEVVTRSSARPVADQTDVYLADSMGELKMLYAAADVAFVGGSLVPVGGHNVLEPALVGVPVLFGMQMFNFQDIAERLLAEQAVVQCADVQQLADAVLRIYRDTDYRDKLAATAKAFVLRNQGATRRVADLLIARWRGH